MREKVRGRQGGGKEGGMEGGKGKKEGAREGVATEGWREEGRVKRQKTNYGKIIPQ